MFMILLKSNIGKFRVYSFYGLYRPQFFIFASLVKFIFCYVLKRSAEVSSFYWTDLAPDIVSSG